MIYINIEHLIYQKSNKITNVLNLSTGIWRRWTYRLFRVYYELIYTPHALFTNRSRGFPEVTPRYSSIFYHSYRITCRRKEWQVCPADVTAINY
jgi:hypothetical protein